MDKIAEAIAERRLLIFSYEGLPRIVVPAVYGYTQAGNLALRAYQVGGHSHSGHQPSWRLFTRHKMLGLALSEETFTEPPPRYRARDGSFQFIRTRL